MTRESAMSRVGKLANERVEVGAGAVACGDPLIGEVTIVAPKHLDGDGLVDPHASPIRIQLGCS